MHHTDCVIGSVFQNLAVIRDNNMRCFIVIGDCGNRTGSDAVARRDLDRSVNRSAPVIAVSRGSIFRGEDMWSNIADILRGSLPGIIFRQGNVTESVAVDSA